MTKQIWGKIGRIALIILIATMCQSMILLGFKGGHAHLPFSSFPDYLLISPLITALTIGDLFGGQIEPKGIWSLICLLFVLVPAIKVFRD